MIALRRRGRKIAYLEARCAMLERLARIRYKLGTDEGKDQGLYDAGWMILEARDAGRTDSEIVEAIEDLVALRMMTSLENPVGELTEGQR